ncbi:hypothetical protein GCM10027436_41980 [Actinophytocola sediminis]
MGPGGQSLGERLRVPGRAHRIRGAETSIELHFPGATGLCDRGEAVGDDDVVEAPRDAAALTDRRVLAGVEVEHEPVWRFSGLAGDRSLWHVRLQRGDVRL